MIGVTSKELEAVRRAAVPYEWGAWIETQLIVGDSETYSFLREVYEGGAFTYRDNWNDEQFPFSVYEVDFEMIQNS